MAETPTSPNPPPEDMHWGISYLREDIQDLRFGVRALHDHMDRLAERMERLAEASTAPHRDGKRKPDEAHRFALRVAAHGDDRPYLYGHRRELRCPSDVPAIPIGR